MFGDISWAELLLVGIVALIVIGPEDLPDMFRQLGRFTAKLRQMSRDFSRAMEQAAKDSGVKDVAKDLKAVTSPGSLGLSKVKEAADRFEKWDPIKNAAKPSVVNKPLVPPPMPATPEPVVKAEETPTIHEPTIHGPETQALIDKQAAKKAVLAETAEKMKAIDAGKTAETPAAKPRAPRKAAEPAAPKPRTKKAAEIAAEAAAPVAPKPRKIKKADEA